MVVVFKIWRTVRLQAPVRRTAASREVVVKKRGLRDILRRFAMRILRRLRFELHYLRSRNTPAGLLVWLERRMKRMRMRRKQGETAAAFLSRVSLQTPDCKDELRMLSDTLNRQYFGDGGSIPAHTVRDIRRKLKQSFNQTNHAS